MHLWHIVVLVQEYKPNVLRMSLVCTLLLHSFYCIVLGLPVYVLFLFKCHTLYQRMHHFKCWQCTVNSCWRLGKPSFMAKYTVPWRHRWCLTLSSSTTGDEQFLYLTAWLRISFFILNCVKNVVANHVGKWCLLNPIVCLVHVCCNMEGQV